MAEDSLAILPSSMGRQPAQPKKKSISSFIPQQRGGLLLKDPSAEECPYTFSDSPAYLRKKQDEEDAKRAAELESKDETRGFLRAVEEYGKKQKWEEAHQSLERRTAVPSGLFLVTRAVLRWKFAKYAGALHDTDEAIANYSSSAKCGPLASAFAGFVRICLGSKVREKGGCSREMKELLEGWEAAERTSLGQHALGQGLFHPRAAERLSEPKEIIPGMEATDGSYIVSSGVRIGYTFIKNLEESSAALMVHFHGSDEIAADYRTPAMCEKYKSLRVHLLVVDYRGYGWSSTGEAPSFETLLPDSEPFAEQLPELVIRLGLAWPYLSGIILSGRSLGAQVAIHLATLYPKLFGALILDSSMATSVTGDRLGRGPQRKAALARWKKELEQANLEILQPLEDDLCPLSALDKIKTFQGRLLVLHGLGDELMPQEGSESLHTAAGTRNKDLVLIKGAGHNNIGQIDEYWSSIRRLVLKCELDDHIPSVGETPEPLCAVCAAKAESKCGRCKRVWYCGRGHQAEHWKSHKHTCAGGPPAPKEKTVAEGEARFVALVVANISQQRDVAHLKHTMLSVREQAFPFDKVLVGFWAAEADLAEAARVAAEGAAEIVQLEQCSRPFSMVSALLNLLPNDVASSNVTTWVQVLLPPALLAPRCSATLLPPLRRASGDARIAALNIAGGVAWGDVDNLPQSADDVAALLGESKAKIAAPDSDAADGQQPSDLELSKTLVRLKVLKTFVETTPAGVLDHPLCDFRFSGKLQSAFGKKVQRFDPPEGDWLLWPSAPRLRGRSDEDNSESPTPEDKERAEFLHEGFLKLREQLETMPEGRSAGSSSSLNLETIESSERALVVLRRRTEKRLILLAGEEISPKELKNVGSEEMQRFLEEVGLDKVIGLERWRHDVAAALSKNAAELFGVKVSTSLR